MSDTPRTDDAACDDRKQAFDEWYFTIHSVMPDLLNRLTDQAMWVGWSAGMQLAQREANAKVAALENAAAQSMPDDWYAKPYVERLEDMSVDGYLAVQFDGDGDVIVSVWDGRFSASVEFCTIGSGGGGSPHTKQALIQLFKAMERDNLESNKARRGKRGRGAVQQPGEQTNG